MTTAYDTEPEEALGSLAGLIARIAHAMKEGALPPGDLAQLRRIDVDRPDQPTFWRLMAAWIAPDAPLPPDIESAWAAVLSGMAHMAPFHHKPGRRLGMVLAEVGYSELRLNRLLRTGGHRFLEAVRRTCAFLAARAEPVDWTEFAALILTRDPEKAEDRRRRIARDFYSALQRKENE
jgi:CRISPR system Cascade subunit CasB